MYRELYGNGDSGRRSSNAYNKIVKRRNIRKRREKLAKMGLTALLITAVGITAAFKINEGAQKQPNQQQNQGVDVVYANEPESKNQGDKAEQTPQLIYPSVSSSYVEITSEDVKSAYVALLDVDNNKVVAGRECDKKIYPASMTKVMTLIVAVENIKNMTDTFTMTAEIIDPLVKENASRAGFDPGEVISANDLLYGMILPSGADAADGLAEMLFGSKDEFVKKMNQKCSDLGLKNTHFMNTSGLHDENQYTTPVEMAMIFQYAMENETCAKILSAYQYTTAKSPQHPDGILLTSTMFSRMYGDETEGVVITSGKTGYTIEAGNCLVSYAQKGNSHYVAVTAGATNKWHSIFDDFEIYKSYAGTTAMAQK